ncbi:MAG: hypothetical protein L3J74_08120 [Bacteroidales bacterium]|nr:hypothetical protein [Bacteroidales bacterium]
MVGSFTYSNNIFDAFSIFSSFSLSQTIWESYEKYAIRKLEDATLKTQGLIYSIKEFSTKELIEDFEFINKLMPILNKERNIIESINDVDFLAFKKTSMKFFNSLDILLDEIDRELHKRPYNKETLKVLNKDTSKLKKYKSSKELYRELGI